MTWNIIDEIIIDDISDYYVMSDGSDSDWLMKPIEMMMMTIQSPVFSLLINIDIDVTVILLMAD